MDRVRLESEGRECRRIAEGLGWKVIETGSSTNLLPTQLQDTPRTPFAPWRIESLPPALRDTSSQLHEIYAAGSHNLEIGTVSFKAGDTAQAWIHYAHAMGSFRFARERLPHKTLPVEPAILYVRACSNYALCCLNLELPAEAVYACQSVITDDTLLDTLLLEVALFTKLGHRCAIGMDRCGDSRGAIEVLDTYKPLGISNSATEKLLSDLKLKVSSAPSKHEQDNPSKVTV